MRCEESESILKSLFTIASGNFFLTIETTLIDGKSMLDKNIRNESWNVLLNMKTIINLQLIIFFLDKNTYN